jgi:hypothetical protein
MDKPPFATRRHGVGPGLAEKTQVVGMEQLFNRVWIPVELLLEKVDGLRVLIASKKQLLFAVAAGLLISAGQHRQQADGHHRDGDQHHHQRVTGICGFPLSRE